MAAVALDTDAGIATITFNNPPKGFLTSAMLMELGSFLDEVESDDLTDALLERNGVLAKLSDDTLERLNEHLPAAWSHNNPVDVLGDASAERLAKAVEIVLADEAVHAALVLFAPQAMSKPTDAAKAVIAAKN